MSDIDAILIERSYTHGAFREVARISQHIKSLIQSEDGFMRLNMTQRETLDMLAIKIARILAGEPDTQDHWTDISGYARLAEKDVVERTQLEVVAASVEAQMRELRNA